MINRLNPKARPLLYAAGFYALGLITGYLIGSGALHPAPKGIRREPPQHAPTPAPKGNAQPAQPPLPRTAKLIFSGGVLCECAVEVPASAWEVVCGSTRLPLTGTPPAAVVSEALLASGPRQINLAVPGWNSIEAPLPAANANGDFIIPPQTLSRKTASLKLIRPRAGTDYDTAQIAWLRPLPEEPLASPRTPGESCLLDAPQDAGPIVMLLPTGVYKITLKNSGAPERIRETTLVSALELRAGKSGQAVRLPSSMGGDYVGFGGTVPGSQSGDIPMGYYCGIRVDVRSNSGQILVAFRPLKDEAVRYADLKPRPDTCWPISNVYLEDPARVQFDCNLNHGDYRVTVDAADGRTIMLPRFIAPENEDARMELQERMKKLVQDQLRQSKETPEAFDPAYRNALPEQIPIFRILESQEQFQKHLERILTSPTKPVEIGGQAKIERGKDGLWEAHFRTNR